MQAALKRDFVSVEDYLADEAASRVKHEYIGGGVYAMAGATVEHNLIAINIASALRTHLKGKPCRTLISDVKLRLNINSERVFYYPNNIVGCDPRDKQKLYLQFPRILVEIASESTERLDRTEKRVAYQTIETLEEYLIVAQERTEATIFRRANNWNSEVITELAQPISIKSIGLSLPLSAVYDGISLL